VQHERSGVEADQQIFRAPAGAMNALTGDLRRDVRIDAPAKARFVNL
jgi:hypothetical protein